MVHHPTYYDVLGVAPDADRDAIKQAWRHAADRFEPGAAGSGAHFQLFNKAAEVLLDPERRAAYDAELAEETAEEQDPGRAADVPLVAPVPGAATATLTPDHPGETSTGRGVPGLVLALLAVLAAAAVALAAVAGFSAQRAQDRLEALDRAPAAAERAAAAVLSYDFESLQADRDAAAKFLTDDYRDEYVTTFDALVTENAEATQARVEAEVLASSAMLPSDGQEGSPARVPVLLFVNQTTVSTANEQPTVALNRVRLDMLQVDGTWLVDGITSY